MKKVVTPRKILLFAIAMCIMMLPACSEQQNLNQDSESSFMLELPYLQYIGKTQTDVCNDFSLNDENTAKVNETETMVDGKETEIVGNEFNLHLLWEVTDADNGEDPDNRILDSYAYVWQDEKASETGYYDTVYKIYILLTDEYGEPSTYPLLSNRIKDGLEKDPPDTFTDGEYLERWTVPGTWTYPGIDDPAMEVEMRVNVPQDQDFAMIRIRYHIISSADYTYNKTT